jgi:hypothetical protein
MNFRSTYVLMGVVAALLIGLAAYVMFFADETPTGEGYLFGGFRPSNTQPKDITTIEIERGSEKLTAIREGPQQWKIISPITARADANQINSIIQQALDAKIVSKEKPSANLSTYGLDKPALVLTLKKGDKSIAVSFGKVTLGDPNQSLVYVLTPESSKPRAIHRASITSLLKPGAQIGADTDLASVTKVVDDLRDLHLLASSGGDAIFSTVEVRLSKGDKVLDLVRQDPDRTWQFKVPAGYGDAEVDPPQGSNPEKITSVRELLNRTTSIQVADPKHFIDNPTDLGKMGLDPSGSEVLKVEVTFELPKDAGRYTQTLYLGKQIEGEPDKVYAMLDGDSSAAMVNASTPRALLTVLTDPVALRDKNFFRFKPDRIDAIDVNVTGPDKFELRQFAGFPVSWKIYSADAKETPANLLVVENLLKQLTQPNIVQGFPPAGTKDDAMGFDKPVCELKLWEKGIVAAEKPDPAAKPKVQDKPSYRVIFGKPSINETQIYARRWVGENHSDVLVPKSLVELAMKPRVQYLDSALKSFFPDQASKLTFTRGGENWEIARDEKDTKPVLEADWKFNAPPSMKGKTADASKVAKILGNLGGLKAIKIIKDNPSAADLDQIKLNPDKPKVKISVKLQSEMKERTYYLGDDVEGGVYAKTDDSPLVYVVPKTVLDDTQTGQLQDMVVYRVDEKKIKGLKLKGWSAIAGEVLTRDLQKKDGAWVFKTALAWTPDGKKVENFLQDVRAPRADAIIEGGIKPDYQLDPKLGGLEIELEREDGKPVTLTIGAVAPDKIHVYATSNQNPGEVFTLLADRFKAIRESAVVFK